MDATLRQDALAETYADLQKLIENTVRAFCRRYYAHCAADAFVECMGEAQLLFIRAFDSHDPNKQTIAAHVRYHVWKRLLDRKVQEAVRHRILPRADAVLTALPVQSRPAPFDLSTLLAELSEDARAVVKLTLNLERQQEETGPRVGSLKRTIRAHLSSIGWGADRITETFCEIKRAL